MLGSLLSESTILTEPGKMQTVETRLWGLEHVERMAVTASRRFLL